jgi:hypothetical protein
MLADLPGTQREIVQRHLSVAPVRIGALAEELGLEVKLSILPPNISGEIRPSVTAPSGFRININRHEIKERQRFTIAHEIGHFLFHSHLIGMGVSDTVMYRSGLSNSIEAEANRAAADLLMPFEQLKAKLDELGGVRSEATAAKLSTIFAVSLPAMKIRLGIS